jgi:hypothetical protein
MRISVIDASAQEKCDKLYSTYPQLDQVCEISFTQAVIDEPKMREKMEEWASDENSLLTVVICSDDSSSNLSSAIRFPPIFMEKMIPILVKLDTCVGLADLIERSESENLLTDNITHFGTFESTFNFETIVQERLDTLARKIHELHLDQRRKEQNVSESDLSMKEWRFLDEETKESNRRQADHISIKLRALKYESKPHKDIDDNLRVAKFTEPEIEILAEMEHSRWCTVKLLAGWKYGKEKDWTKKISPYLVSWDRLSEKIKDYDRIAVKNIFDLLDLNGQGVSKQSYTSD